MPDDWEIAELVIDLLRRQGPMHGPAIARALDMPLDEIRRPLRALVKSGHLVAEGGGRRGFLFHLVPRARSHP